MGFETIDLVGLQSGSAGPTEYERTAWPVPCERSRSSFPATARRNVRGSSNLRSPSSAAIFRAVRPKVLSRGE
jgi:hypothetical protein